MTIKFLKKSEENLIPTKKVIKKYTYDEVKKSTSEYFDGDELATDVWVKKYALKDSDDNYYELTPNDMHHRIAKELARIENKYSNPMSENEIFELLKDFKYLCVTKDTVIMTKNGPKLAIDLLNVQFEAVVDNVNYKSTANGFYKTANKTDVYKVLSKEGFDFKSTKNHQVFCLKNKTKVWKETKDLLKGDKIIINTHNNKISSSDHLKWGNGNDSELNNGWLLGYLYGDGTFNKNNAFLLFMGDNKQFEFNKAIDLINKNDYIINNSNRKFRGISGSYNNINSCYVIASVGLKNLAAEYGMFFKNKGITNKIDLSSSNFHIGFLQGWFDADGTVGISEKKNSFDVRLSCSNYNHLQIAQKMLLRLGIFSRIYKRRKAGEKIICGKKCNYKDQFELVISGFDLLRFANIINFSFKLKKDKLKKVIQKVQFKIKKQYFATVEDVIFIGKEDVYDCTIPGVSAFDGNGVYLHNCPQGSILYGAGNNLTTSSLSNCYVIGTKNEDSYASILKMDQEMTHIYRRRGGVGLDLSFIRPNNSPVDNVAITSTGVVPFMKRFSNTTNEVAMSGRRGANLLGLSITHPDSESFIDAKTNTTEITGSNISVKISDEFMKSVKNNKQFTQQFPIDSKSPIVKKDINSKKLWDKITHNAHSFAEPGIIFDSRFKDESISDVYLPTSISNPCGEILMNEYSSCILTVLNMYSYVEKPFTKDAFFNFDLFEKHAKIGLRFLDDVVDLELEKLNLIFKKIKKDPESDKTKAIEFELWGKIKKMLVDIRRLGLGITGMADMLAAMNVRYDSSESIKLLDSVFNSFTRGSFNSTVQLAKERGSFKLFNYEKEKNHNYIKRVKKLLTENEYSDYKKYGRRNISLSTISPSGSISTLTKTSSGFEPVFMLNYKRRRKVMDLKDRVDFTDELGVNWQEYNVFHQKFIEWYRVSNSLTYEQAIGYLKNLDKNNIEKLIQKSPYYKSIAQEIDPIKKLNIQQTLQKHITHSISNTYNLPKDASVSIVSDLYFKAWELGLKGITIYRDGSRSGVLVSNDDNNDNKLNIKDRPEVLSCDIHHVQANKKKYYVIVGLDKKDKPYEIFAFSKKHIQIPQVRKEGKLIKIKSGIYNLKYNGTMIENIANHFESPQEDGFTRMVSLLLRRGVPALDVVEQINKSYSFIGGFYKAIARVLGKNYIDDVEIDGEKCPECGANIAMIEGCKSCSANCGWAKC